jgi:hypothetical protein
MRPLVLTVGAFVALVWVAAIVHGRVRVDPFARAAPAPRPSLAARPIDPNTITTTEPELGVVAYRVPLPSGLTDGDAVELRFRAALDGAKVEAFGEGPRLNARLLRKRVGGDTVVVPLTPGRVDVVEVRVHRNLREPSIVREVVVMAPISSGAGDPPRAASARSIR